MREVRVKAHLMKVPGRSAKVRVRAHMMKSPRHK